MAMQASATTLSEHSQKPSTIDAAKRSPSKEDLSRPWFAQFRFIVPLCIGVLSSQSAILLKDEPLRSLLSLAKMHQAT